MIDDETINRWRANYGLVERNPIQAAQFWEMTNGGMAPAGAVAALGICLDELAEMHAELAEARRERDRLREAIDNGPCSCLWTREGRVCDESERPKTCWKRAALEGKP